MRNTLGAHMLGTPIQHFNHDISRARQLAAHAQALPEGELRDDILRASWMMAVGACDAYFSDAYADLISRALRAKDLEPSVEIPDRLSSLKVPVVAVLRHAQSGWRWRMAARELIETENVLSLEKIRKLFNQFFREGHKLLTWNSLESWILDPQAKRRLFGLTATEYRALGSGHKPAARRRALQHLEQRFTGIFQRRHDCIHNCDRPKSALQAVSEARVSKCIDDAEFLVVRCQAAFMSEFPAYLANLGFSGTTRNQVCQ
jgi:hypothetical protein